MFLDVRRPYRLLANTFGQQYCYFLKGRKNEFSNVDAESSVLEMHDYVPFACLNTDKEVYIQGKCV